MFLCVAVCCSVMARTLVQIRQGLSACAVHRTPCGAVKWPSLAERPGADPIYTLRELFVERRVPASTVRGTPCGVVKWSVDVFSKVVSVTVVNGLVTSVRRLELLCRRYGSFSLFAVFCSPLQCSAVSWKCVAVCCSMW